MPAVAKNAATPIEDATSDYLKGLDGVYPAGVAVAKVSAVDRQADSGFARITLLPTALPDGVHHVLVLEPLSSQLPARPEPPAEPETPRGKRGSKR